MYVSWFIIMSLTSKLQRRMRFRYVLNSKSKEQYNTRPHVYVKTWPWTQNIDRMTDNCWQSALCVSATPTQRSLEPFKIMKIIKALIVSSIFLHVHSSCMCIVVEVNKVLRSFWFISLGNKNVHKDVDRCLMIALGTRKPYIFMA